MKTPPDRIDMVLHHLWKALMVLLAMTLVVELYVMELSLWRQVYKGGLAVALLAGKELMDYVYRKNGGV